MDHYLSSDNWGYTPTKEAKAKCIESQRFYLYTIAAWMPHHAEAFNDIISLMERNAKTNKYTGWKALAREWARFINACCTPPNVEDKMSHLDYGKERLRWIDNMTLAESAIHHRAIQICAVMMDGASYDEALEDWAWMWKNHPDDNRDWHGDYEFRRPDLLVNMASPSEQYQFNDYYFTTCNTSVEQFKLMPRIQGKGN